MCEKRKAETIGKKYKKCWGPAFLKLIFVLEKKSEGEGAALHP